MGAAAVVRGVDCVEARLQANHAEQPESHEDERVGSDAVVLDELLEAVLVLEDLLLVLAGQHHLLAAVLPVERVLLVQVRFLHLLDYLDDVVPQPQRGDALLQAEGVLVLQGVLDVADVREGREHRRDQGPGHSHVFERGRSGLGLELEVVEERGLAPRASLRPVDLLQLDSGVLQELADPDAEARTSLRFYLVELLVQKGAQGIGGFLLGC